MVLLFTALWALLAFCCVYVLIESYVKVKEWSWQLACYASVFLLLAIVWPFIF